MILRCKWCNREIRSPLRKNQKFCNNWDRNDKSQICVNAYSTWTFNQRKKIRLHLAKSQLTRPTLPSYNHSLTRISNMPITSSSYGIQGKNENTI